MTDKTFQCFKAGTHRTMAGDEMSFTVFDLQRTARAYSAEAWEAPLVIGHPKDDIPVRGVVRRLEAQGDALYATASFGDELLQAGKERRFKGVSVKFFRPEDKGNPVPGVWYLRHVGFLEDMNPAVKGMTPVAFCEVDALDVMFAELPANDDMQAERLVQHKVAGLFMSERPGMSYAAAAKAADLAIREYRAGQRAGGGQAPGYSAAARDADGFFVPKEDASRLLMTG